MRRLAGVLFAVGALVAGPSTAAAAPVDFTSGSASFVCLQNCGGHVSFTGHGTPTDAHGNVHFDAPGLFLGPRGSVDCVAVAGNRATVSGVLEKPGPGLEGPFYALEVEDNGSPGAGRDRIQVGTSRFPVQCAFGNEFPPVFPVERGNVVVQDMTP